MASEHGSRGGGLCAVSLAHASLSADFVLESGGMVFVVSGFVHTLEKAKKQSRPDHPVSSGPQCGPITFP